MRWKVGDMIPNILPGVIISMSIVMIIIKCLSRNHIFTTQARSHTSTAGTVPALDQTTSTRPAAAQCSTGETKEIL